MDALAIFLANAMTHAGTFLPDIELVRFVENLLQTNPAFHQLIKRLKPDEYQHLVDTYVTVIKPRTRVDEHMVLPATQESRLRVLEREHENTRAIEASLIGLLNEQRIFFLNEISQIHAKFPVPETKRNE
jgi:hypothetical protein